MKSHIMKNYCKTILNANILIIRTVMAEYKIGNDNNLKYLRAKNDPVQ